MNQIVTDVLESKTMRPMELISGIEQLCIFTQTSIIIFCIIFFQKKAIRLCVVY